MKHLELETLLAYWLHETDTATTESVDAHLMACDGCAGRLDEVIALGDGIRSALRAGAVGAVASAAFVEQLARQGLRLREYRLPHNGSVNCAIAPGDDLLVTRLSVPLQGVQRLDAVLELSTDPGVQHRMEDLPFDPQAGEVVHLPRMSLMRQLPAHTARLTLLAVEPGGTRELGHYAFHHGPPRQGGQA